MAFHVHLIDPFWEYVQHNRDRRAESDWAVPSACPRLTLRWELGDGGRAHARWTRD